MSSWMSEWMGRMDLVRLHRRLQPRLSTRLESDSNGKKRFSVKTLNAAGDCSAMYRGKRLSSLDMLIQKVGTSQNSQRCWRLLPYTSFAVGRVNIDLLLNTGRNGTKL